MQKLILLSLLTLVCAPAAAQAAPIYSEGNECPTDAQMPSYSRQYYVTQALRCVFETITSGPIANIHGSEDEADAYLNSAAATLAGWGTAATGDDWVGLDDAMYSGFSFTADGGNDDGTFTFGTPLTSPYNQFALGIKDGGNPKWAIFMLPVNTFAGDWGFGTEGGELSHFALFGRNLLEIDDCPNRSCDPDITEVPEPATLLLLGSGLTFAARRKRAKR